MSAYPNIAQSAARAIPSPQQGDDFMTWGTFRNLGNEHGLEYACREFLSDTVRKLGPVISTNVRPPPPKSKLEEPEEPKDPNCLYLSSDDYRRYMKMMTFVASQMLQEGKLIGPDGQPLRWFVFAENEDITRIEAAIVKSRELEKIVAARALVGSTPSKPVDDATALKIHEALAGNSHVAPSGPALANTNPTPKKLGGSVRRAIGSLKAAAHQCLGRLRPALAARSTLSGWPLLQRRNSYAHGPHQ